MPAAVGILKEAGSLLNYLFPDGKAPLVSIYPDYQNENEPMCFYLDGELLSDFQIAVICYHWLKQNPSKTYEEAYTLIRMGYPVAERHFRARFASC